MLKEERCEAILNVLTATDSAVSATALAKQFQVSRQIIVQDIALLRAKNNAIIATARGYLLSVPKACQRIIEVRHNDQEMEEELTTIVDLGGKVVDVFVKHQSYGTLSVKLSIKSRLDIQRFLKEITNGKSKPLKHLTLEHHFHTVCADSIEILDLIETELMRKGYIFNQSK